MPGRVRPVFSRVGRNRDAGWRAFAVMSFLLRKTSGTDDRPDLILSQAEAACRRLSRPRRTPRFPGGELR